MGGCVPSYAVKCTTIQSWGGGLKIKMIMANAPLPPPPLAHDATTVYELKCACVNVLSRCDSVNFLPV